MSNYNRLNFSVNRPLIRQEMGLWLNSYQWDWFFTGTFRQDVKSYTAINRFKAWVKLLKKKENAIIGYFWALEWGSMRDTPHIHALLKVNSLFEVRRDKYWKVWFDRNGRARILPYENSKGAGYYLSKYLIKDELDWGFWDIDMPT